MRDTSDPRPFENHATDSQACLDLGHVIFPRFFTILLFVLRVLIGLFRFYFVCLF